MSDKPRKIIEYDYKGLIQSYVDTKRTYYVHADFRNYYNGLLATLQKAFGLEIMQPTQHQFGPLIMLFQSTAESFNKVTHPGEGFLEAGLLEKRLDEAGEKGKEVRVSIRKIYRLNEQSKQAHLEILYTLFQLMFGEVTKVVTSQDLLELGFDDSKKPQMKDYWDYI